MQYLIYTIIKSHKVVIPNDPTDVLSVVSECFVNYCACDYYEEGIYHLLNEEKTQKALSDLSSCYKVTYPSIQRFPSSLKTLADGEGLFVVEENKASLISRRAAIEALYCKENWKDRFEDVKKRLSALATDFNFMSFGFDGISMSIGEPDKAKRICRFCGKTGANHFRDTAHAIQDSLGNRLLVCYEECDDCNHKLKNIEDNFLVMMDVRRSLFHIGRKDSAKSARVVGDNFVIVPDANGDAHLYVMQENIPKGAVGPFMMRLNHKTVITNEKMYKALVKMVIDLVPSYVMPHFRNTVKWIGDNNWCPDVLPTLQFAENKSHFYRQPVLDVFLKKDQCGKNLPYCTAILWIYDVIYMYVVPLVDVDAGRYKYDNNLVEHWQIMVQQLGDRQWLPQNGFDYTPATVWIDTVIDTANPFVHVRPMGDTIFIDCQQKKREPDIVSFPKFDPSGIHLAGVPKATFSQIYYGNVIMDDLRDITIHASAPTFFLFPLTSSIKFMMGCTCCDTTDSECYFSVEMDVDFNLDDFWSNLELKLDKDGNLYSYAFDYHLRDYLYNLALVEAEKILVPQRYGTPFVNCTITKLVNDIRFLDRAELMIPTNDPRQFQTVELIYHF